MQQYRFAIDAGDRNRRRAASAEGLVEVGSAHFLIRAAGRGKLHRSAGGDGRNMKKNLLIRRIGSTLVMVENSETPSDAEWNEFLSLLARNRADLPKWKLLVMTTGGGPNTVQRKRLEETLGGTPMRVAVVSDNMKVRFIASTIALFHRDHRSFSGSELTEAYGHLGLSMSEQRQVELAITEMKPSIQ